MSYVLTGPHNPVPVKTVAATQLEESLGFMQDIRKHTQKHN